MSNNTILYYNSNGEDFTIKDYECAVKCENKERLANFVYNRLYSRYIKPFEFSCEEYKKHYKSGFAMMASFSLLIETIQCFKEGQNDGKGMNQDKNYEDLFKIFFNDNKEIFEGIDGKEFYENIRCGILHQGEIIGGWKLSRKDSIKVNKEKFCIKIIYKKHENGTIEYDGKTIQVNNFMNVLKKILEKYRDDLKKEDFNSNLWKNYLYKMIFIISNCKEIKKNSNDINYYNNLIKGLKIKEDFKNYYDFTNNILTGLMILKTNILYRNKINKKLKKLKKDFIKYKDIFKKLSKEELEKIKKRYIFKINIGNTES